MVRPSRSGSTDGFTLVEATVALLLSTILVLLVWSVFLAQNELYQDVVRRSGVHDDARSVAELVASEVRPTPDGGFVVAEPEQLVLREPLSMGVVCGVQGNRIWTYLPRSSAGLDTASVTGYGVRDSDGTWAFYPDTWNSLADGSGSGVANQCASEGFEITGLDASHFHRLQGPGNTPTPPPEAGDAFMLFRDLELRFATSTLDPDHTALYRGTYGETLVEYATGLAPDSGFQYRLRGEDDFSPEITGGDLDEINAVRVTAVAVAGDQGGGLDSYEYRLVRDVPTRNENDGG